MISLFKISSSGILKTQKCNPLRTIFLVLVLTIPTILVAQNRDKAFTVNQKLGRGINFGNMFEAPSETAWGNQWQPEYSKMVAELGFNHVRIPIRWEPAERSSATAPYSINATFLNRIKQVVDSALNNKLYVIINMHHHEDLYENPVEQKARFLSQWKQISTFFADYPDQLLFEILNEPHGNLTADKWNVYLNEALLTIRETNKERVVLVGTPEYGGLGGLSKLRLPDDKNIIVTVHYYNPFHFTHQGASWAGEASKDWLGTKWNDTETEREVIQNDFAPLQAFSEANNVPVHIGEFGAYSAADIVSRGKWTTYLARYLESLGWSWAYWEYSAGFGIYDTATKSYNNTLVNALLHNKMPQPSHFVGTSIYTSNFATVISDWNLITQAGASASKEQLENKLVVTVSAPGTQNWHIQLIKSNIQIEKNKKYRLTFKAKTSSTRSITSYVGQSASPWESYSGYNSISLSDTFNTYSYVFDATTTDNAARIVFDLGNSNNNVIFESIALEEVNLQTPTSARDVKNAKSKVYPNPVDKNLTIENWDDFENVSILNMHGEVFYNEKLSLRQNTINLEHLSSGIYFVKLMNQKYRFVTKIIKN